MLNTPCFRQKLKTIQQNFMPVMYVHLLCVRDFWFYTVYTVLTDFIWYKNLIWLDKVNLPVILQHVPSFCVYYLPVSAGQEDNYLPESWREIMLEVTCHC